MVFSNDVVAGDEMHTHRPGFLSEVLQDALEKVYIASFFKDFVFISR